jgi:RND family efflux transporter MFP subunit
MLRPNLSFFLAFAGVAAVSGCGARPAATESDVAPLVATAVVEAASGGEAHYTGAIRARIESDLGFRIAGKISERLVDPGTTVRQGQIIMRLDPADVALAASAAEQRLRAAEADAGRSAADEGRLRDLVDAGAVSASSYDAALAAERVAAANLAAARAAAGEAANQQRYAALVADSDGVVIDVLAQPGQVIGAGAPVVRLAKAGPREALVSIPETALAGLAKSGQAQIYGGLARYPATLREIAGAADPLTRTYAARYTLGGAGANAPLGATVSLDLASSGPPGAAAPLGALYDPGSGPGVWTVGTDQRVHWRKVQVLAWRDEDALLAPGGVQPGERIVVLGAQLLRDGERIRLAAPSALVRS